MSSKEKPVQGEAGAWRVRPHDTDLSAARVINDARLAESMAAHRWLVEPLTELPTPAESQPQGVEAVAWQRRVRGDSGVWMDWQEYHDLYGEGRPVKVGRFDCEYRPLYDHPPAAQSEVSPANTSPTIAAPGLTPTLLQSLGDVERGALTPAQRELLGQVKNTHMAYVAQAHTKTQSEYHASVVDAISAALRSQGQADAVVGDLP